MKLDNLEVKMRRKQTEGLDLKESWSTKAIKRKFG
jgi:hypothetical protein